MLKVVMLSLSVAAYQVIPGQVRECQKSIHSFGRVDETAWSLVGDAAMVGARCNDDIDIDAEAEERSTLLQLVRHADVG
jgi:hypothetical protein